MVGPSCQPYNWQMGRCDSIAFGSSPRRGKLCFQTPVVLQRYLHLKKTSGDNREENSGVDPIKTV